MVFWKKKMLNPKKRKFSTIENEVIKCLINELPENYGKIIKSQFDYLTLINTVKYKNDVIIEFYPEKYNSIPLDISFGRTEEFRLAVLKYEFNECKFTSEIHMVMGHIFDIKFRPIPSKKQPKNAEFKLQSIKLESNLDNNIY